MHLGGCGRHRRYHMTCAEQAELERAQGWACGICATRGAALVIDHDHGYGMRAVRGLVCPTCNQILRWHDSGHTPGGRPVEEYLRTAWHLTHRPGLEPLPQSPGMETAEAIPVGPGEVQKMLGVSRQRFGQLRQQPGFPEPWEILANVTLWRDTDIEKWAKAHGRKVEPHNVVPSKEWKP